VTDIKEQIERALGVRPRATAPLTGGCVGEVYRCDLGDDAVVAKVDRRHDEGTLHIEGRMLRYLRANSSLPVPEVFHEEPGLLVMEFIDHDGARAPAGERGAADMLADLHGVSSERYGFDEDTLIGALPQPNPWTSDWATFYGRHRLLAFGRLADRRGSLPAGTLARLESLADGLHGVVGTPGRPSLVHGDVWSGNVLWHKGRVRAFIDPAVHFADAEVELAFIELFGCFGPVFWDRYAERRPIRPGFERRCAAYQLAPLLVHAALFGGGYGQSVASILDRLGHRV
jgi:fructosamine-3-kinase